MATVIFPTIVRINTKNVNSITNKGILVSSIAGGIETLTTTNGFGYSITLSAIATSTGIATATAAHNLIVGSPIEFNSLTGGTGVSAATVYYVVSVPSATTFTFSATLGGSAVVPSVAATAASVSVLNNFGKPSGIIPINAVTKITVAVDKGAVPEVIYCTQTAAQLLTLINA